MKFIFFTKTLRAMLIDSMPKCRCTVDVVLFHIGGLGCVLSTSLLPFSQKDLIILKDVHRVFAVDALASSHPLSSKEEDIIKPEQISEQFDAISYSKVRHF